MFINLISNKFQMIKKKEHKEKWKKKGNARKKKKVTRGDELIIHFKKKKMYQAICKSKVEMVSLSLGGNV
jgi:hypothetical protein